MENKIMSDIWVVNGKTWYSKRVIDKIVDKCRKYCRPLKEGKEMGTVAYMENGKVVCKVEPVVWQEIPKDKSLADEILELLKVML
jgi:hypothetical protein